MNYVYLTPKLFGDPYTVGFYKPDGKWEPSSDHTFERDAAQRVHWLNGGNISEALIAEFGFRSCERGLNWEATLAALRGIKQS